MPIGPTLTNRNTTTSPGSLASLANINAPQPGYYQVQFWVYFAGTAPVDGTDSDNILMSVDNVLGGGVALPAVLNQLFSYGPYRLLTTGLNIKLVTSGVGTVGTIYRTFLVASPCSANLQ